ncbi:MAG: hypothetical protein SGJ24_04585 [Chloroflexota bacterium]|nr:hypothetical protein [Chloroflexota bacterium]
MTRQASSTPPQHLALGLGDDNRSQRIVQIATVIRGMMDCIDNGSFDIDRLRARTIPAARAECQRTHAAFVACTSLSDLGTLWFDAKQARETLAYHETELLYAEIRDRLQAEARTKRDAMHRAMFGANVPIPLDAEAL